MIEPDLNAAFYDPRDEGPSATVEPGLGQYLLRLAIDAASRKWFIVCVTGLALITGVVVSLSLPVWYTSTTRIMTPQQTSSSAGLFMNQMSASSPSIAAAIAADPLGRKNPNDLYIGLLSSRPVADALISKMGLIPHYKSKDMTAARAKLAENTKIVSEKSGMLAISVEDKDRTLAAAMANTYTEQLRSLTKTLALSEVSQRRLFYEDQLTDAKEALVEAEASFRSVQLHNGLINPDAQTRALVSEISQLHAQIDAKQVEIRAAETYSTDQNPDVQLLKTQLASLQRETARLEQRDGRSAESEDAGLHQFAGAGLEFLRAQRNLQYRQALYDLLIKQYDAARLDEAKEAAVIQVVEVAIPSERRSAPRRLSLVILFMALGFFASCLYVWGSTLLGRSPELRGMLGELKSALFHSRSKPAQGSEEAMDEILLPSK